MIEIKEFVPRRICTDDRLEKLRKAGIETNGYERNMEFILKSVGYKKPTPHMVNNEWYFAFCIDGHIRLTLNYADACADKLLYLHEIGII